MDLICNMCLKIKLLKWRPYILGANEFTHIWHKVSAVITFEINGFLFYSKSVWDPICAQATILWNGSGTTRIESMLKHQSIIPSFIDCKNYDIFENA